MSQLPPPDTFMDESRDRSKTFFENHPHRYRAQVVGRAALVVFAITGSMVAGLETANAIVHSEKVASGTYDLLQGETPEQLVDRATDDLGTKTGIPTEGLDTIAAAHSLPGGTLQPGTEYEIAITENGFGSLGVHAEPVDESK